MRKKFIKFGQVDAVNEAVEGFDGNGEISGIHFAKKDSGYTVNPRVAPRVGCRKYGNIRQAAKVDQALDIAALWAKGWVLVGTGPCSADVAAEYRKFMVKLGNAVTMQRSAFWYVGKGCVNAFKFNWAQVDYALPEASHAISGKHGSKIDAVCKSKTILLF